MMMQPLENHLWMDRVTVKREIGEQNGQNPPIAIELLDPSHDHPQPEARAFNR